MSVSKTIFNQLGGHRFTVMTGGKNFVAIDNGLQFKIGRNKSKANLVQITLNNDLYTVRFSRFAGVQDTELKVVSDLFAADLRDAFTSYTGLFTSL